MTIFKKLQMRSSKKNYKSKTSLMWLTNLRLLQPQDLMVCRQYSWKNVNTNRVRILTVYSKKSARDLLRNPNLGLCFFCYSIGKRRIVSKRNIVPLPSQHIGNKVTSSKWKVPLTKNTLIQRRYCKMFKSLFLALNLPFQFLDSFIC